MLVGWARGGVEYVMQFTAGFADGFYCRFKKLSDDVLVDLEQNRPVSGWQFSEQRRQLGCQIFRQSWAAIQVGDVLLVDDHTGLLAGWFYEFCANRGLPDKVAVIAGAREQDDENQQQKSDVAHCHGGDTCLEFFAP